jgi:hypothetical protein
MLTIAPMMQLNLINNEDKEIENIFILTYSIVSDFNIYFYFILCQEKKKRSFEPNSLKNKN